MRGTGCRAVVEALCFFGHRVVINMSLTTPCSCPGSNLAPYFQLSELALVFD